MKYFGIIKKEEIVGCDMEEIDNVLLENEVYDNQITDEGFAKLLKFNFKIVLEDEMIEPHPSIELIDEFNNFICHTYKNNFIDSSYDYFAEFNEINYGMEESELRKIALSDFNEIYSNLNITAVAIGSKRLSANGILHTHTTGKIFKLYHFHQRIKKEMANTKNLIAFLTGDLAFYTDALFEKSVEIREAVRIQYIAQILVELNDKYNFEEDLYYSNKVDEVFNFKDYNFIFKNLKAYRFTNYIILNSEKLKRTFIESLYQVLIEFDLIIDHKENFIAFIKDEYRFIVTKITTFKPKENLQNDKRITVLTQEWMNYDVQKTNLDMFLNF